MTSTDGGWPIIVKGLAGGMEMREFLQEVIRAIKEGPAIYFAPIGAAIRSARSR